MSGFFPRRLRPAAFVEACDWTFSVQPRVRASDRMAAAAQYLGAIRERKFEVVAEVFADLRDGALVAVGTLPCGLTIDCPAEIWSARNVVVDTLSGALSCDDGPLFTGVDVGARRDRGKWEIPELTVPQAELAAT